MTKPATSIEAIATSCIAGRLRLLNRVVTNLYDDALRPFGVRLSQGNVLAVTAKLGVARPAEVCAILELDTSTLSRTVDRMVENGWLEIVPDEDGLYSVKVSAGKDQKDLGSDVVHVRAAPGDAEYFEATMRAPLMKRIAEETSGRFFTPENAAALPEAISFSGRGVTVVEERDLWDMPAVLLLLITLTGTEWAYRRARGLA